MAGKGKKEVVEDLPPGVPGWMLTFCDCMTLLLTFFVLLLSFSSFDEAKLKQLTGVMKFKSYPSISVNEDRVDKAVSIELEPIQDHTDKGAEKKRTDEQNIVKNPKKVEIPVATDAYHEETVLNIPIDDMFHGDTVILTPDGKDALGKIASYLRLMPLYYVIIGESSPQNTPARSTDIADAGMHRKWAILEFLKKQQNLTLDRFRISGECPRPRYAKHNKPAMQIILLARDVTHAG